MDKNLRTSMTSHHINSTCLKGLSTGLVYLSKGLVCLSIGLVCLSTGHRLLNWVGSNVLYVEMSPILVIWVFCMGFPIL